MPIGNNSGRIMSGYKKWLTKKQRNRLSGLYRGLRQSTADEMRDQYLAQRGSMDRVRDVASSYGLGAGYRARKQMTFDRAQEQYGRQLAMQADNAFESEVVKAANESIQAENERRQKEYARRLKAAQNKRRAAQDKYNRDMAAYNKQQARLERLRNMKTPKTAQTWKAPVVQNGTTPTHVSPFSWQAHTLTQYTDTGTGNNSPKGGGKSGLIAAALLAGHTGKRLAKGNGTTKPRAGANNSGGKLSGVEQYTDSGTGRSIKNVIGRPTMPNFETDPSFALPLEPEMQAQIDAQIKEFKAATPEQQEQIKLGATQQYVQDVANYSNALERFNTLARNVQQAQSIMVQFKDLEAKVRNTSYSPEQRRGFSQQLSGLQRQYASIMQQQRGASQEISGLQRYIQNAFPRINASRALLGGMGVKYSADDVQFDAHMASSGISVPAIKDKQFWKYADKVTVQFTDDGQIGYFSYDSDTYDWLKEHGYANLEQQLLSQYGHSDGALGERKTLAEVLDPSGAEGRDTYFSERGLYNYTATHNPNIEVDDTGKLNINQKARDNWELFQSAQKENGILEDVLVPIKGTSAWTPNAEQAGRGELLSEAYARAYNAAIEEAKKGETGQAMLYAMEFDYLADLVRQGDESAARALAIDLLTRDAYTRVSREFDELSPMQQQLRSAGHVLQNTRDKDRLAFTNKAAFNEHEIYSAVKGERQKERWVANAKTPEEKARAAKWSDIFSSAVDSSIDNMPARLIGFIPGIGSAASKAKFFMQAFGQAKQDALRKGKTLEAADSYALVIGACEVGLESLIGGIPLGGKSTVSKALEELCRKLPNAALRTIAEVGVDAFGEFTEESLQEILEPVWGNLFLDEKNEFKPFNEQTLAAGLSGAISAVLGGAPQTTLQQFNRSASVSSLKKAGLSSADANFYLQTKERLDSGAHISDADMWTYLVLQQALTNGELLKKTGTDEGVRYSAQYKGSNLSKNLKTLYENRNADQEVFDSTDHRGALSKLQGNEKAAYMANVAPTGKVGDMYYVTTDGKALDISKMSFAQKVNYTIAQKLAKAFPNIKVYIHDSLPGVDGGYQTTKGKGAEIHLSLSSKTILATVAAHEILHGVESHLDATETVDGKAVKYSKDYRAIVNYLHAISDASVVSSVEKAVAKKYGIAYEEDKNGNRVFKATGKRSAADNERLFNSEVATHLAEKMFTDDEFLDRIIRDSDPKNQTARAKLVNRVRDALKKAVKALRGEATISPKLSKLQRTIEAAYRQLSKSNLSEASYSEEADSAAIEQAEREKNSQLDKAGESVYNEANDNGGEVNGRREAQRADEGQNIGRDNVGETVGGSIPEGPSGDTVNAEERELGRANQGVSQRALSGELREAYAQSGKTAAELYDYSDDRAAFSNALDAARNADSAHGWAVTPQSVEDLNGKALFMDKDGTIGAAVTKDGDIEGAFKNKELNTTPHALDGVMPQLIAAGGAKLDCYGEGLVRNYENYGFIPVARVEFNPEYANAGWNESKGRPYIYFLYHNGDSAAEVVSKIGEYPHATEDELNALPTFGKEGYDQGMELRDNLLAERKNTRFRVSDEEYMSLAEKYRDGTASAEDIDVLNKAVEEAAKKAGYTIKAYHGTGSKFTEFDKEKWGANYRGYSEFGGGFYFTPDLESAKRWADNAKGKDKNVLSVYLSAKRILGEQEPVKGGAKYLQNKLGVDPTTAETIAKRAYRFIDTLSEVHNYTPAQIQSALGELGYDAIDARSYQKTTGQFVVFDPSQIKSADPITYDDNGNIIPLSERFNAKDEDIRFRISDYSEDDVPVTTPVDTSAIKRAVKSGSAVRDRYGYTIKVGRKDNNRYTVTVSRNGEVINTRTGTATPELNGADIERTAAALVRNIRRGQARSRNMDTSDIYIEKGEKPARDVNVPKMFGDGRKVSKLARTIAEAAGMTDEAVDRLLDKVNRGFLSYTPSVNQESMDKALGKVSDNMASAVMEWESIRNRGVMKMTPDDVALGSALMISAANSGDIDSAMEYAAQLQDMATAGGKLVQSFRMIKRLGAAGAFYYINRQLAKINTELEEAARGYKLQLNQELVDQLLHATDYHEIRRIVDEIRKDLGSQLRPTLKDWFTAWRYTAMLGNFKTIARNYLGNALFIPSIMARNVINAGLQTVASKIAPTKFQKTTRIFASKAFRDFATWDWNDEVKYDIKGNKYSDETNEVKEYMKYTTGAPKWLKPAAWVFEQWRSGTQKAMETEGKAIFGGDMLFKRLHYKQALATQLQQRGANTELLKTLLPQMRNGKPMKAFAAEERRQLEIYNEAAAFAQDEANRNTYNDLNAFAQEVARISRRLNTMQTKSGAPNILAKAGHYAAEGLLPFKNTPFNIASRATEFSPIGLVKTLTLDTYRLTKGQISGQEYIRNISGGLTGSMLFALGAVLARMGVLRGGLDYDDPEEEMLKKQGHQAYALEIGDTSVTLDWLAPEVIPMFMGVEFYNELPNIKAWKDTGFKALLTSMGKAYEPMLNMSMLQGVNALFEGAFTSSDDIDGIARAASTTLTSFVTQFQPTILTQLARTIDPTRRTTYIDKGSSLPPYIDKFWQKALMKVPFASKLLTPYLDEWGKETVNHPNGWLNAFEQFLSPAYISTIKTDPVTQKLTELGAGSYPNAAKRYIDFGTGDNKQRFNLSSDEFVAYSALRGETAYAIVQDLINDKTFNALSDADQLAAFKAAYTYGDTIAQSAILEMKGLAADKVSPAALEKWVGKANEYAKLCGRSSALAEYIAFRTQLNGMKAEGGVVFGNIADYTVTNKDGTTSVKWSDMKYDYLASLGLPDNERLFLADAFGIKDGAYKQAQAAVAEVPNLTVDAYTKALDHWQDLTLEKAQKKEALSEAEYEKWLAGNTNAFKKYLNDTKDLTGQQKFALLTKIGSSDGWEGKANTLRNSYGVSYDDAWKAAYKASALTSTDEASKNAQYMAYLNSTKLDGKQKFGLYGSFGSSTSSTLEKATAFVTGGTYNKGKDSAAAFGKPSYDALWNAYTAYNGGVQHEAFYDWLSKQSGINAQQRFACCEFTNSTSAWMERAAEVNSKMGIGYDTLWKIKVYWRNESGQGKKARITAYCKKLGLRQSQVDKLYALKFLS